MKKDKWYVTMTDKFMSGWGRAEGKICKYVYECDSIEEARVVEDNARARGDQKNVNVTNRKPYYNPKTHLTMLKDKNDSPAWYEPGYFRRQR